MLRLLFPRKNKKRRADGPPNIVIISETQLPCQSFSVFIARIFVVFTRTIAAFCIVLHLEFKDKL